MPYPIPNVSAVTAKLGAAGMGKPLVFCSLDMLKWYWQVSLDATAQGVLTMVSSMGLFTPTRVR